MDQMRISNKLESHNQKINGVNSCKALVSQKNQKELKSSPLHGPL